MAAAKKSAIARLGRAGKFALGGVMLVVPLLAYYVVFHSELQSQINAEQARHATLRQDLDKANADVLAYQNDLDELSAREQARRELVKILPETTEYPAFLSSVQNVANLVGIELVAWTPQEEIPEEFYSRVPMKLELRGRFHQLAKFFYNVGQLERIINMEDIAISAPKANDSEAPLTAIVLATAFHATVEATQEQEDNTSRRRGR